MGVGEGSEPGARGGEGGCSDASSPDGGELAVGADSDASRVDVELELLATESVDPVKPLDPCADAGCVDGPRGETGWAKDLAATGRPAQRLLDGPCWCEEGGEVGVEEGLELEDLRGVVEGEQRLRKEGDGVCEGDLEVGGGHG